jgi:hypothetical protein
MVICMCAVHRVSHFLPFIRVMCVFNSTSFIWNGPGIIYRTIGSSPPKRKPLAPYFSLRPLPQSTAKEWCTSRMMCNTRLACHYFAVLSTSGHSKNYQVKGSRGYYTFPCRDKVIGLPPTSIPWRKFVYHWLDFILLKS